MVYPDPNGLSDLANARVLFNSSVSYVSACYVFYKPAANQLLFENVTGTAFSAPITPGPSATVSNSQCTLNGTGSSFSTSGNNLTLNVSLTFTGTFTGQKNVYLLAACTTGTTGNWVLKGTWTP
jgi:hypothetical protein